MRVYILPIVSTKNQQLEIKFISHKDSTELSSILPEIFYRGIDEQQQQQQQHNEKPELIKDNE